MAWLVEASDGALLLALHIQPNARRTEFCGLHGEALKLRLAAPPVDGKANAALLAFLAAFCEVPKASVQLLAGASGRAKRVRIAGGAPGLRAALEALA